MILSLRGLVHEKLKHLNFSYTVSIDLVQSFKKAELAICLQPPANIITIVMKTFGKPKTPGLEHKIMLFFICHIFPRQIRIRC